MMHLQTVAEVLFVVLASCHPFLINANVVARRNEGAYSRTFTFPVTDQVRQKQDLKSGVESVHNGKIIFQDEYSEPLLPMPTFPPPAHVVKRPPTKGTNRMPTHQKTSTPDITLTTPSSSGTETKTTRAMEKFITQIPTKSRPKAVTPSPIMTEDPVIHGSFYVPFRRLDSSTKQKNNKTNTS